MSKEQDSDWVIPPLLDDDVPIEEILKDYEAEDSIATSTSRLRVEKTVDGRVIIYAVASGKKKI